MYYRLNDHYALRGWAGRPGGIWDAREKAAQFLEKESYQLVMKCDGAHDIDIAALPEPQRKLMESLLENKFIRPAGLIDFLLPEQEYRCYSARWMDSVHWSVTGACNLKCRHCFMSAPHAKHGVPTHEQIIKIADEMAACGVCSVGITGGEPLIREDFLDVIDALNQREIGVRTIYTNGWLVDERLLDELEKRGTRPSFQLSFDGIGKHDFLRGIPGAEERTLNALKLLKERKIHVSVSMCLHRDNRHTLRDTVNLMASLGVKSMKAGAMIEAGEWLSPDVAGLQLSPQENLEMIEQYIPQYFEDNAPLAIMLSGAFMYTPGQDKWGIYYRREVPAETEDREPACGVLVNNCYIGADGMVAPCMGMCDCGFAAQLPNIFQTPLKEILAPDSEFSKLCTATVAQVRDRSGKCRDCTYADRCTGGCRNNALMEGDNYYAADPEYCFFFENGWEERITAAAQPAFEEYIKRCPPKEKDGRVTTAIDCP